MSIPLDNLERLQAKTRKYLLKDFKARKINSDPYLVKINNLISDEEIGELLELAKNKFEKSNIMVDGELVYSTTRTSSTAYIFEDGLPDKYSKPIERMIKRICFLTKCERSQIEIMAVRYKKGEKFDKHVDYFEEDEVGVLDRGGNRIITFFVYLNTLPPNSGGETEFTKLKIKSKPKKGDAVFWYNQDPKTGKMLPMTEHRGNPVLIDTIKYGINIWIRSNSFY
jgi:prolyl 4-hydroxylase